ncbi:unnamed protein product [Closterium sp. Naga37s-1]|nr:unnamed protein product [Closterium sp. Naga37s-1]
MVIAGDPWPSPKPAAAASAASGRSPPVYASGSAALKPPVPPAPKPAPAVADVSASPTPDLVSCEAPASLLLAPSAPVAEPGPPAGPAPSAPGPPAVPVNPAAPHAVAEPVVAPPVPELPAALPAVAVPVAPDAAVGSSPMAVSATTGGPGSNVSPAGAVYGHAALFRGNSLDGGPQDECLDAADRLAELLAPVLAAPARCVIAGVGQLGTAVRGLKRVLRAGTGDKVIGASAAVVRELHRSQTGLLAVHDADQF